MARPIWITKSSNLSTINEAEFFQYTLTATNADRFFHLSGQLPPGMQVTLGGVIQGVPVITDTLPDEKLYTYKFAVRAVSVDNLIADRSFELTVSNIKLPVIVGPDSDLGTFIEGEYVDIQLEYTDSTPGENVIFTLVEGLLPNIDIIDTNPIYPYKLTLSTSGRLSGYIFAQPLASQTYNFVVEIKDGINSTRKSFSLTTVQSPVNPIPPIVLNAAGSITPSKHDNFYSYKFLGYDFDGDPIEFYIENNISDTSLVGERGFDSAGFDSVAFDQYLSISTGLVLDPTTGWLYGKLPEIVGIDTYTFAVAVRKTVSPGTSGKSKIYRLNIFSASDEQVRWLTDSDLGEIYNGAICELSVQAVNTADPTSTVYYRIRPYDIENPYPIKLPQGLIFKDNGLIIGRPSFRYFSLDNRTTTFDNQNTSFDETYTFTVDALDENNIVLGFRTFTVRVVSRNLKPYENVYIKALLEPEIRAQWFELINDRSWLADSNVYRPEDLNFGRCQTLSSLFLPGIVPELLSEYVTSTEFNHYNKQIKLSSLKLARAQDSNFSTIYEIIYAEIQDDLEINNQSVALEIDLYNKLADFYQVDGIDQTKIYPNSFRNMRQRLLEKLVLENRGVLPKWMTSVQENGDVLGFVRAIPLVYCRPGTGKIALQDLQNKLAQATQSGFINSFNFVIDRYNVDQYLSRYFDVATQKFISSSETTFDRFSNPVQFLSFGGNVDYAVTVPFDRLNNANIFQLLGSSNIEIISPEVFSVEFAGSLVPSISAWSTWMNQHAVWYDRGLSSLQGTVWVLEREFYVETAGIYQMYIMNTDSVVISINNFTAATVSGLNITGDPNNYVVDVDLPRGKNNIKMTMTIGGGNPVWRFNPKGISVVISNTPETETIVVFDTRVFKDPKIKFNTQTLQPGIDGEYRIQDGQTLIFKTQDYFPGYPGLELDNHGWNRYLDLFGTNYDDLDYNEYTVIPGLGQPINQRAGVWSISIDSKDCIKLTFEQEVIPGTYFKILRGETYSGKLLRLNSVPDSGNSELSYYEISTGFELESTEFDGGDTKFFDYRDLYLDPNRSDKYVKYPKLGVFK